MTVDAAFRFVWRAVPFVIERRGQECKLLTVATGPDCINRLDRTVLVMFRDGFLVATTRRQLLDCWGRQHGGRDPNPWHTSSVCQCRKPERLT